jgi:hypothetical protein
MSDVETLASVLVERYGDVRPLASYGWPTPPLNVIDCVLSLNRHYDTFVVPRVRRFEARNPQIVELEHLRTLIGRYSNPFIFSVHELDYRDQSRAETLKGVVLYLIGAECQFEGLTEYDRLHQWANSVCPTDSVTVGVRGFGLAGFQYLRMLFGVQTTKPDRHIKHFVSDVIGHTVSDRKALLLLEEAAELAELNLRDVDNLIWQDAARSVSIAKDAHPPIPPSSARRCSKSIF